MPVDYLLLSQLCSFSISIYSYRFSSKTFNYAHPNKVVDTLVIKLNFNFFFQICEV